MAQSGRNHRASHRKATAQTPVNPAAAPVVLGDYALLADGERGIVIGPHGDLVWMCFPRWHDPALFSALVGGGGSYSVTPVERHVWGGYYEPASLIWRSRWVTNSAVIECREALALPARADRAIILRRIVACRGAARVRCTLRTLADFGSAAPLSIRREGDVWTVEHKRVRVRWSGAAKARPVRGEAGALELEVLVAEGSHHDLVMSVEATDIEEPLPDADIAWSETEAGWARRVPQLSGSFAPRDARHGCAVMLGLTSGDGGMVAAATTSLPESVLGATSYDYRFAWIRDQCYAGHAGLVAGVEEVGQSAVTFVSQRLLADGPDLKPAYTVTGGPVPDQRRLRLPGYPGGSDIVGNWVNDQSSSTHWANRFCSFPPPPSAIASTSTGGERWRLPCRPSNSAGRSRTRASGSSTPATGLIAD